MSEGYILERGAVVRCFSFFCRYIPERNKNRNTKVQDYVSQPKIRITGHWVFPRWKATRRGLPQ